MLVTHTKLGIMSVRDSIIQGRILYLAKYSMEVKIISPVSAGMFDNRTIKVLSRRN